MGVSAHSQKVDVAAPWHEVGRHFGLVGLVVGDLPDRGEGLQRFTIGVRLLR